MSLLAIDAGNTEIALGVRADHAWQARWRVRTSDRRTADEYRVLVRDLFELDGVAPSAVEAVAIASVVPAVTPVLRAMSVALFHVEPLVVGPDMKTGMPLRYEPVAHLGSDRLADAVAARARHGSPVVVVDFGTATTFTVVDAGGTMIGGAIAPGIGVAALSLAQSGARLRRIDLSAPPGMRVVGKNTEHSMRAGVLYGYAGLVDGMLARIDAEMHATDGTRRAPVVATGGMSTLIAPLVRRIDHVEPDLTLDGVCLLHALNAS